MSAGEWFPWLALTGIFLGPYFIYEAKGRVGTVIGWAITVPSAVGILYVTYTFLPSWLDLYFFVVVAVLLLVAVAMSVKLRLTRTLPDAPAMSDGSIEVRMTPAPDSGRVPYVQFETANRDDREIDAGGRPNKLRFVTPKERLIVESDLPATVRLGWGRKLVVKRFTNKGFTLEEHHTHGVTVKIETYFEVPLIPQTPHEVIGFDYFPASPLDNGWRIGYFDRRISESPDPATAKSNYLKTRRWTIAPDPPVEGCVMIDIDACAIDRDVTPNAALSQRIEFEANYINDSAMFFVRVLLATRDEQRTTTKIVKFIPGSKKPYRTPGYQNEEYTVEIADAPSLGNGWRRFILSLPDEIEHTWGQDGWRYKELKMIRIRGKLGISPIRLY
jgi:hypothetical protein